MKVHALVPALALAAALLVPPVTEAASRHRSDRGRSPAHGYYGQRPSYRSNHGSYGYRYRTPRPYYRSYRYNAVPYGYYDDDYYGYGNDYGYGYGNGYGNGYGYDYYPPPPRRYYRPRPRVRIWFGF